MHNLYDLAGICLYQFVLVNILTIQTETPHALAHEEGGRVGAAAGLALVRLIERRGGLTTFATYRSIGACVGVGGFNSAGTVLIRSPGLASKTAGAWFRSLHGLPANCK